MSNPANQTANAQTVREYLLAAYVVDPAVVDEALPRHTDVLARGISFGSHAYYVGNDIAEAEGWPDNPDYDPDAEDDVDDDE